MNLWQEGVDLLQPTAQKSARHIIRRIKIALLIPTFLCILIGSACLFESPATGLSVIGVGIFFAICYGVMTWMEFIASEMQDISDIKRYELHVMLIEKKDFLESIYLDQETDNKNQQ